MEGKILSLQEKMVLIRKEIPALVKRAYSEEVNYDFTKIDDIFRYLTPAMNRYKVNWEIESETATIKDNLGNPIYVRYLERAGLWMYEADLAIRWINAELPEDSCTVTVHAIGTHEMPEKAKGSGWTYALKYYLLDKYGIDQGGEDPDMRRAAAPDAAEYQPAYEAGDGSREENNQQELTGEPGQPTGGTYETVAGNGIQAQHEERYEEQYEEQPAMGNNPEDFGNLEPEPERPARHANRRPVASRSIQPQSGKMVELPESAGVAGQAVPEAQMPQPGQPVLSGDSRDALEEACRIVCGIGVDRGKTLGEIARSGDQGIDTLKWIAYHYKGRDEALRQGARLILEAAQAAA